METFAVFRTPKNVEGILEEPVAIFIDEHLADIHATRLSLSTGEAYMIGKYTITEQPTPLTVIKATLCGHASFSNNGSSVDDFTVRSCRAYKDGDGEYVDGGPKVDTSEDSETPTTVTFYWMAIEDVKEDDTFDTITARVKDRVVRNCQECLSLSTTSNMS